jgi:hypothetical protein
VFAVCSGFAIRRFDLLNLPSAEITAQGATVP